MIARSVQKKPIQTPKRARSLADLVAIERRFHRSTRIDQDLYLPEAVEGYILQPSAEEVLHEISRTLIESKQRAFTITGPYGGGKSSLMLILGDFVSTNERSRKSAEKVLGPTVSKELRKAFPINRGGWLVVPLQGRRANAVSEISQTLSRVTSKAFYQDINQDQELVSALTKLAKNPKRDGVLLIIDELGKLLESVADGDGDIHLFQELAEAAGRSEGPLVVVGLLHQAFEGYVAKLGRTFRDEWAKVQGRFIDIPFRTAPEESLYLLGKAIKAEAPEGRDTWKLYSNVAESIRARRTSAPRDLAERLILCWPLHPLMPGLLGAYAKKRFGQNERSIFGFLTSQEPFGFQAFLKSQPANSEQTYNPDRFWDYLRANFESSVLASAESHRWSLGMRTVERTVESGTPLQVGLAKTIAIMDFFGSGAPGADLKTLCSCFIKESERSVKEALEEMERASTIIYRKHLKSWATFAGSDFEISIAVDEAKAQLQDIDLSRLTRVVPMGPVIAKRHYHTTGAFRWFSFDLVRPADVNASIDHIEDDGRAGRFLLVLPTSPEESIDLNTICKSASQRPAKKMIAIGSPKNASSIQALGLELLALRQIQTTDPRLSGDDVARREVQGHIADLDSRLEQELQIGFTSATWYVDGRERHISGKDSLSALASDVCDVWYEKAPHIFSELVNRHRPTRNSQAGVRDLLACMVKNSGEDHLGIEGYPAQRGLYDTVLGNAGLHRNDNDLGFGFYPPDPMTKDGKTYLPFWEAGQAWLRELKGLTSLEPLFDLWSQAPYGLHRGLLPIIGMAFLLCFRDQLAIHVESVFQTDESLCDGTFVDCLYRDPALIQVRYVPQSSPEHLKRIVEISQGLCEATGRTPARESLALAQQLKSFSDRLHPWVHKTKLLSKPSISLRQILQKASDPNKLLFEDIPNWGDSLPTATPLRKSLSSALKELGNAYETMLRSLENTLWEALGVDQPTNYSHLKERAARVHGVSGDLRMDAFAGRIAEMDGSLACIEGLCAFALNKPTRDWLGSDPEQARFQIMEIGDRFRKTETFADFCGKEVGRQGMALIVREGKHYNTMIQYFDVGEEDQGRLKEVIREFKRSLSDAKLDPRLKLAALAAVTADILSTHSGQHK